MLKIAIVVLAAMVGLKLWAHEHFYRQATSDALLNAYVDRAARACRRHLQQSEQPQQPAGAREILPSARVVVGDETLDVAFWNVGHPDWATRYKTIFLHLSARPDGEGAVCRFDTLTGEAFTSPAAVRAGLLEAAHARQH